MYQVMLVDDEYVVREGIKNSIDWKRHGFQTVRAYSNGKEAIQALQAGYCPDLIITDICMPFVNGLDFTKYAASKNPPPMVIIISGYDDFKFAQQAVKLGVYDYILKPVTANGINEIIDRARAELDSRNDRSKQVLKLKDRMNDALPLLQTQCLNALIKNKIEEDKISSRLQKYGIRLEGSRFTVALIQIDSLEMVKKSYHNIPEEILKYAVFNVTQEIAQEYGGLTVFQSEDNACVVIFSNTGEGASARPEEFLSKVASLIRPCLKIKYCTKCRNSCKIDA